MDTLPQELLVMITANVSDFNDLKRCALVCRDLYSASRIHFFHMVRLEIGQSHSRSLHRVLTASPHHAPLIRVLEIYDNRYSLKDSDLVDSFAEFAAVLLLLTHLENIQLLLISKIHHPPRFFTALSDAIIPSLKLPSLITWRIITAHPTLYELDHADLLIHATSLKNLSISKLYTTESRAATKALPAKAGPRARLEVLHCRFEYTHYGAEQRWLLPELRNVDLTGLHALRMFQLSPAAFGSRSTEDIPIKSITLVFSFDFSDSEEGRAWDSISGAFGRLASTLNRLPALEEVLVYHDDDDAVPDFVDCVVREMKGVKYNLYIEEAEKFESVNPVLCPGGYTA